ncbi:XVIPCD domain-containing protein [Xanthomonas arboricola pv. corylina]|uniref:XVIPCD domain-containing protein n=1 Tax=Xanthomonas arboricola TaxID=56448 RepID=UPI004040BA9D
MPDTPVFRGHHIFEQVAYKDSQLLQELAKRGLFDLHGEGNILNLPVDRALAAKMGISPHGGGPLAGYSEELATLLKDLENTPDGKATLGKLGTRQQQAAAAERMGARIADLDHTLRAGLVNGDLFTNAPEGISRDVANAKVRRFFGDVDGYERAHTEQINEFKAMRPDELRWRAVTQSEANVNLALEAIKKLNASALSPVWGGHASFGNAIEEANQAGRLPLTEHTAANVRNAFNLEKPLTITRPAPTPGPGASASEVAGHVGRPSSSASDLASNAGSAGATEGAASEAAAVAARGRISGAGMLTAAGVAALAVDFAVTGHRVAELRSQGNQAGAESATTHFVGRTTGGIAGGVGAGFVYGLIAGSETGPGAVVTGLVGGVVGGFAGEYWAQQEDKKTVYTQVDRSGNEWSRDPEKPDSPWTRTVVAPTPEGGFRELRMVAGGRLVDELNYKSANDAYSLGLANLPEPKDPFRIDASGGRTPPPEPFETSRHYVRNPQNGEWNLSIHEVIDGRIPVDRAVAVSPEQSVQLEVESLRITAQNAVNTPEALTARYQVAYEQYGWRDFANIEPVPEVITNAQAQPLPLMASDGHEYTQGGDGKWTTPGTLYGTNTAEGNVQEELNRTRQSQEAGVQELFTMAQIARENPTPTELGLRGQVISGYRAAGIARTPEEIDAAVDAVTRDHARDMPERIPYSLRVQKDGSLVTLAGKDNERMEIKSVTTPEEIAQAHARRATAPEAQPPAKVTPTAPSTFAPAQGAPVPHGTAPATQDKAEVDRRHGMAPRPEDAGLVEQLRSSVARLDEKHNKPWDHSSDRLLASAYRMAAEAGFKPGDKVDMALSEATETRTAGSTLFVMRSGPGASPDPAANRAHMPTQEALAAAPEQQYAAANQSRASQQQDRAQELAQAQTQQGPRMA